MNFPNVIYADTDLVCGTQNKFGHEKYVRADLLKPFLEIAQGIPNNWPGDCVLFFDLDRGRLILNYCKKNECFGGGLQLINDENYYERNKHSRLFLYQCFFKLVFDQENRSSV